MEGIRTVLESAIALSLVGLNFKIVYDWLKAKRNGTVLPEGIGIMQPSTTQFIPSTLIDDAKVARSNTEAIRTEATVLRGDHGRLEDALGKLTEQSIKNGSIQQQQLDETKEQTKIMRKHFNGRRK